MVILSWLVRILALLAVAFSFVLYISIKGELEENNTRIDNLTAQRVEAVREKDAALNAAQIAQSDSNRYRSDLDAAQKEVQSLNTTLGRLRSQISEVTQARDLSQAEVRRLEQVENTLRRDILEMGTQDTGSDEVQGLLETERQMSDNLRGRIVDLERRLSATAEENNELQRQLGALQGDVHTSGSTIMGRVLRIDAETATVVINLGNQQVKPGQQLVAFNPAQNTTYTLEVRSTGPNFSLTQVISRSGVRSGLPSPGDEVTNL